jgi:hypothetical protein
MRKWVMSQRPTPFDPAKPEPAKLPGKDGMILLAFCVFARLLFPNAWRRV